MTQILKPCPFDETVEHELRRALDNYENDPDESGAINRLANNCVSIGYEFAARPSDPDELREALEPFAAIAADPCFADHEDSYAPRPSRGRPCLGDYRRARKVLTALSRNQGDAP